MPPRRRPRSTDPEFRYRNMLEATGLPALAGLSRLGLGQASAGGLASALASSVTQNNTSQTANNGQLLVWSVAADSIASGGDYVAFDTEVYRRLFENNLVPGATVTWPVGAVGSAHLLFDWASYEGGGTIALEVDGTVPTWGTFVDDTTGARASVSIPVDIAGSAAVKLKVTQSSGSAQTAAVVLALAVLDPIDSASELTLIDSFFYDYKTASASSSVTLTTGRQYRIVVTGNARGIDGTFSFGTPDDIVFVSSGEPAEAAQLDAETVYADVSSGTFPAHRSQFEMDLGSGSAHVEPTDGQHSAPTADHSYNYDVTGEGSALTVTISDSPRTDNNGQFRIEIYEYQQ